MPNSTAPDSRVLDLVREDLRDFGGYKSARSEALRGDIGLNANESAWANPADTQASCRRYPDPQPQALRDRLAQLYGCTVDQLLIGRGSDEAIDLLVRALCVPGRDAIVVTPPVFGMYAVCARLQDARIAEVPLDPERYGKISNGFDMRVANLAKNAAQIFLKLTRSEPLNFGGAPGADRPPVCRPVYARRRARSARPGPSAKTSVERAVRSGSRRVNRARSQRVVAANVGIALK